MNETLTVTAHQADQSARAFQRSMNAGRRVPKTLPMLQKLSDERKVYIFNVGPWQHTRHMGTTGTFTIQACPEGKEYSDPLVIPGIVFEPVPKNEKEMELQSDEGRYVAEQIIGIGKHLRATDSLVHMGVFISDTPVPNKKELEKAKTALNKHLQALVKEMNDADALGTQKRIETQTPDHFVAARLLGYTEKDCRWMKDSAAPAQRNNCDGCGQSYVVGIERCSCGRVLDREKFIASVRQGLYPGVTLESLGAK